MAMIHCNSCGSKLGQRIPAGDNRPRHVCDSCGDIHYLNPRIIAGSLPTWGDQVLLCRRAIEPRKGYWTLPAGFMENGESASDAAARETLEEANARIRITHPHSVVSIPHINQVYLLFSAELLDLDFSPGDESLETQLFSEADIPWQELAFPVMKYALQTWLEDRGNSAPQTRFTSIDRRLRFS